MGNFLRHLAMVMDGLCPEASDGDDCHTDAVAELLKIFSRTIDDAFSLFPDLAVLSLFSPDLQKWALDQSRSERVFSRCREGFRELEVAAHKAGADLCFAGRPQDLPPPWPEVLTHSSGPPQRSRRINMFLNYSGREELVDAARQFLEARPPLEVSEEIFAGFLATAGLPDPDLIILAGGELELKDFLLWQSSYAEIWHSEKNCLEFSREDLGEAAESFFRRQRRFGKV